MITKDDIITKAKELQNTMKQKGDTELVKTLGFEMKDIVEASRELSVGSGFEYGTEEFIDIAAAYLVGIQIGVALEKEQNGKG